MLQLFLFGYALSFIPDELDTKFIEETYVPKLEYFVAEKSEFIQYATITVSFPLLFIAFYNIVNKSKIKINEKIEKIIDGVCILLLLILIVTVFWIESMYIEHTLIFENFWMVGAIIIFSIFGVILYRKVDNNEKFKKILKYISIAFIIFIIGIVGWIYINNSYAQTEVNIHHVDAYFYPIYKVNSGLTPGIDFDSLYGYYSYVFSAIMGIFGTTSIFSFSIIISILVVISFICLTIISNKIIHNKVILSLVIFSCIYTLVIHGFIAEGSYYLQYVPHRILFPSIILAYIVFYLKFRNKKYKNILQFIGFIISAFAIFWNMETGVVVLGTWIMFLGYEILFFNSFKEKKTYKEIGKVFLMTCFTIIFYFVILNLITFARTGNLIHIKNILFGQSVFMGSGFFMIKMNILHPWILFAFIYGVTLAITIKNLKFMGENNNNQKCYERSSIIFAIAILGIGIFSYYQGRSHNYNLYSVLYPGIIILGYFLDKLIMNYSNNKGIKKFYKTISIILIMILLTVLSSSTIYSIFGDVRVEVMLNKNFTFKMNLMQNRIKKVEKIKNIVGEIDFILPSDSYYYVELGIKDKRDFYGYVDLFRYSDYEKIIKYMQEKDVTICTDNKTFNIITDKYSDEFNNLINNKYKIIKGDFIILLNKNNWDKIEEIKETNKGEEYVWR